MLLEKTQSCLLLVDVQEKLAPFVIGSETLIERCAWLMRLADELGVPILTSEQYPKGLGPTVAPLQPLISQCIDKVTFSSYQSPEFQTCWSEFNKNQAVIAGIETHVCVLQTALDLRMQGVDVFVVVDAVSSRHEMDYQYALKRMASAGVHLLTGEMVFFEWLRRAGTLQFKTLSQIFLARSTS